MPERFRDGRELREQHLLRTSGLTPSDLSISFKRIIEYRVIVKGLANLGQDRPPRELKP